mmetsp:Transcript_43523/g.123032  ORF Transcript_43523/g.123032 Transcript_43523/m.123032 type:complete len:203 (+) Transcript_43523:210-818(+)
MSRSALCAGLDLHVEDDPRARRRAGDVPQGVLRRQHAARLGQEVVRVRGLPGRQGAGRERDSQQVPCQRRRIRALQLHRGVPQGRRLLCLSSGCKPRGWKCLRISRHDEENERHLAPEQLQAKPPRQTASALRPQPARVDCPTDVSADMVVLDAHLPCGELTAGIGGRLKRGVGEAPSAGPRAAWVLGQVQGRRGRGRGRRL